MKNKKMMLGSAILLVVLLVVGGTFAWFTAKSDDVVNTFKAGTLKIKVDETFDEEAAQNVNPGDSYVKKVKIKNIGTKTAFVRLKLTPKFFDIVEGEEVEMANADYSLVTYPILNEWVLHDDGYYYYPAVVAVDGETPNIIEEVTFAGKEMDNAYQGKNFRLSVTDIEVIQTTNEAAFNAWEIDPLSLLAPQ